MALTLAVIGNGPAALYLGILMANKGWRVRLFDPKMSWESGRGGAITVSALSDFPRFEDFENFLEIDRLRIHSPKGRERVLEFPDTLKIASREQLIAYLTELALASGVEIYPAKIEGVVRKGGVWKLKTVLQDEEADFIVGADGAAGFARKVLGLPLLDEEMTIEVGYDLPMGMDTGRIGLIQFMPDLPGALWALPLSDGGTSVRLWATSRQLHARHLFEKADAMVKRLFETPPPLETSRQVCHVPIYRHGKKIPYVGDGWGLIAEAAGFVNPLSQDGLYFGLKSAMILAMSLSESGFDRKGFQKRLKEQIIKPLNRLGRRSRFWKSSFFLDRTIHRAKRGGRNLQALMRLLDPRN